MVKPIIILPISILLLIVLLPSTIDRLIRYRNNRREIIVVGEIVGVENV
jgi:hypothetical protein